ncbi:MAG: hypothetical protein DRQ55_02320 [Planctomycetota bacterium]|nr:MAG: hypothetical protein DRQ55_02320 [Planctomycetota bacterium]
MPVSIDKLIAVLAMLVAIGPLMRGSLGARSHLSWRRSLFLAAGAVLACVGVVGLLALRAQFLGEPFFLPTWLGASLAGVGGMLGVSTVLAGRGPEGLSEAGALRLATQAAAMVLYVASPAGALGLLGATRLLRACLPFTLVRTRWLGVVEGVVLLALCLVPRDELLGGLRDHAPSHLVPVGSEASSELPAR